MPTPFHMRRHQVFLSHASVDKIDFVDSLYDWMSNIAGVRVWYDRNLYGAAASKIVEAFDDSQAALFVVSKGSSASDWVEREFNCALSEIEATRHFRVVSVRLDETRPLNFLKTYSHIDARGNALSPKSAALLMEALFGTGDPASGHGVFFSRGTRAADRPWNAVVEELAASIGCRLVCDAPDQAHNDDRRMAGIIGGCSGLIAVLPARRDGATSGFVLSEVQAARAAGKPTLVFAQPDVKVAPDWGFEPLMLAPDIMERGREGVEDAFDAEIAAFVNGLKDTQIGGHVFIGHSFAESAKESFAHVQRLTSRLAGLPVRVGAWLTGQGAQQKIIENIQTAEFCLIDITSSPEVELPPKYDYGLNSCIEAGIALGAGRPTYITCHGARRTPPFMFRDREVLYYQTELELVGIVRRICHEHRRHVMR
ncbi:toll/interleukin-1 receptor domain-containing protein [Terricaulis sp.]|uniref:toll/interleukin-1 receptor domain-containing protein n=1 Tax=Terricaulis sp. TaxID=2768686 RepID=UPI003782E84B